MSVLAALLQALFGGLVSVFALFIGRKVAVSVVAVGVFTALTVALYGALSLGLSGLSMSLPSWPGFELALWVAAPPHLPVAVSAVLAAEAAATLYRINTQILVMIANA